MDDPGSTSKTLPSTKVISNQKREGLILHMKSHTLLGRASSSHPKPVKAYAQRRVSEEGCH
jgi:hypothetical protein